MRLISGSRLPEQVTARTRAEPDSPAPLPWSATEYSRFPGGRKKLDVLARLVRRIPYSAARFGRRLAKQLRDLERVLLPIGTERGRALR
jgi:hypothetical protein